MSYIVASSLPSPGQATSPPRQRELNQLETRRPAPFLRLQPPPVALQPLQDSLERKRHSNSTTHHLQNTLACTSSCSAPTFFCLSMALKLPHPPLPDPGAGEALPSVGLNELNVGDCTIPGELTPESERPESEMDDMDEVVRCVGRRCRFVAPPAPPAPADPAPATLPLELARGPKSESGRDSLVGEGEREGG